MNSNVSISRRKLLKLSAAGFGGAVTGLAGLNCGTASGASLNRQQQEVLDASQLITGKDKRLIVLKSGPAVFETPLELLNESHITPAELLFVRNNQQPKSMATMAGVLQDDWAVEVLGKSITLGQLKELPQKNVEMVLQCSGNGRSLFSLDAQTKGTQWGRGGVGCVSFGGIKLSKVIEHLGIDVNVDRKFLLAEGKDKPLPDKEDFLHTLPAVAALNRSMLAISMNGKPLPAIHGGPVRLITPGVFGTMHIKWLGRLSVVDSESSNYNHIPRYRVPNRRIKPGTEFDFKLENSKFNWNMKVKTVLLNPVEGARLTAGKNKIQGVAFNDGFADIETVLVSFNKGETWQQSELKKPESKFSWTHFEIEKELFAGEASIWTRAIDSNGRSQPLNGSVAWNPRGYEWNGVEKVTVNVS